MANLHPVCLGQLGKHVASSSHLFQAASTISLDHINGCVMLNRGMEKALVGRGPDKHLIVVIILELHRS